MPAIEIRGLCTRFGDVVIHQDIDLDVEAGQMLGLVGGSGSGKTTLLREIVGLLRPSAGTLKLFGQTLFDGDHEQGRALRRRFGMLFQQGALFSAFSVFDNIAFPLRELRSLDEAMIRDLVLLKLAMVELEPRHGCLMPAELSRGMIKRGGPGARPCPSSRELLVLDETTARLDPDRSENFIKLLKLLQHELGFTVAMVTHDLDTLLGLATRLAVLADQKSWLAHGRRSVGVDHPFVRILRSQRAAAAIREEVA